MTAPTPYARLKNFTDYATGHPDAPFNAADLDAELNAILRTLAGLISNRGLIQRDDGALANDSVHPDSLSTATLLLIEAAGKAQGLETLIRGYWADSTAYTRGQIVQQLTTSYICAVDHISGSFFADDYIAGEKWIILGETAGAGAAALSFSPSGNIEAVTVQTAIEELDAEKAKLTGNAAQTFSVADATGQAHAVPMGQIQRNTLKSAIATGTADAMLATILSGLTVLADGMEFVIEAPGTNTITTPTLNLTLGTAATGAKTIVKGNGMPLLAGDIASNKCVFVYDLSLDKWVLLNPVYQVGVAASDVSARAPTNLALFVAVGGGAISATVITAAGSVPSPSDPVRVPMRSDNAGVGTYNVRTITSNVSLTISAGSTLGHQSAMPQKINWYLIDNAGTLELAASTAYYGQWGIGSTIAEGGAGAADSDWGLYSASARSSVPFRWIAETTDAQATAGDWLAPPTLITLIGEDASRQITQEKLGNNVVGTGPVFVMFTTSAQPLSSGVDSRILFTTESWDTNANFDSHRFTPTLPGYYFITFSVNFTGSLTNAFAHIYVNGSPIFRGGQYTGAAIATFGSSGSAIIALDGVDDFIEIYGTASGTSPVAAYGYVCGALLKAG